MTLLIATGLRREARLMAGPGIVVIAGGGDAARLELELERAAASASAILSSGLAGALDPVLKPGDIVIGACCIDDADARPSPSHGVNGSFDRELRRHVPNAHVGLIWASDRPVATGAEKAQIYRETGALAVDMESHIAARVAAHHGLPFAVLRVISDAADMGLPPAALAGMRPDGGIALGAILGSLVRQPGQLPGLFRTARDAGHAFRILGRVHDVLRRGGIGCLDPGKLPFDMA